MNNVTPQVPLISDSGQSGGSELGPEPTPGSPGSAAANSGLSRPGPFVGPFGSLALASTQELGQLRLYRSDGEVGGSRACCEHPPLPPSSAGARPGARGQSHLGGGSLGSAHCGFEPPAARACGLARAEVI